MNFATTKDAKAAALKGVDMSFEIHDGSIKTVTFRDADGKLVRIAAGESYANCVKVLIPAPPPTERKYVLSGALRGIPVREVFDGSYEANQRMRELENGITDFDLKVEEEDVPTETTTATAEDVPF